MVSAVVGVAGDEAFARWLAEVKNRMNSVRWWLRRNSGGIPADSGTAGRELDGGASQRGVTHMADDRADPIRDNYNPEAEAHLFGIINGDILYVPAEEEEEEDISSYLNLGGEDEGRQRGDDEGTCTVDGGQPSTNTSGDVDKQLAITTSGKPSASGSSKKSVKTKRGKTKTLKQGVTYTIDVISPTGKPLEPEEAYTKFINQCGVVVRDSVPITVQEWHEPVKARVGSSFVSKRKKKECWRTLMEHFVLPPEYNKKDEFGNDDPEGCKRRRLVKEFALQKMATTFRTYKKNLAAQYVEKGKTPDFSGQYEKLKDDWPEFVRQKKSEEFKAISDKNKANAGTEGWDPRAKSWWYGHGGTLDPVTGECTHRDTKFKPTQALIDAMRDAQEGKIKFNRENDALTKALGNPEHGGRVRGKGVISWKEGFSQENDPYSYRSRKRKADREKDVVARLASEFDEMKKTLNVLVQEREAAGTHEDHPADLGSQQRRSSVASTEASPATANAPVDITAGASSLPRGRCKGDERMSSHYPIGNMSTKVAIGSALPCLPGALHHNNPIQDGYARVTVEDIVPGFEDLEIDIATPEGERRCQAPVHSMKKKLIKFPGEAPRPTSPPPPVVVAVVVVVVVVHLHLLHVSRPPPIPQRPAGDQTPPPIHLRQRSRSSPGLLTRTLMYVRPQRQAKILKEKKELAEKQQKKALEEAEKEESKKAGNNKLPSSGNKVPLDSANN
ncbi:hypothetical protein QYE76_035082 [Lolium multiflorum]|uniref:DUF8039 domain-containing protein n=1 Tax=Lolium multiflorum TaxID=4521 RepID=A0AAD8R0W1_LOLMU|nr:hypothetical protein QYE76_035082 [Lolium multiflorum]